LITITHNVLHNSLKYDRPNNNWPLQMYMNHQHLATDFLAWNIADNRSREARQVAEMEL